eukprot:Opistho-2@18711
MFTPFVNSLGRRLVHVARLRVHTIKSPFALHTFPVCTYSRGHYIAPLAQLHSTTAARMATDWKADSEGSLTDFEKHVIWEKGTEPARRGEYDKFYPSKGYFQCKVCKSPLYSAAAKFDSGCGWPAFDRCYAGMVKTTTDVSHGMRRIEITCATCDGHLGHVFEGERFTETNERHCVNSISVKFVKEDPPAGLKEEKAV